MGNVKQQQKWWEKQKKKLGSLHATYSDYCKDELEKMFKRPIHSNCDTCLHVAYEAMRDGYNGYITDEELLEASNGRLKHK
jgi:hypothetical protein